MRSEYVLLTHSMTSQIGIAQPRGIYLLSDGAVFDAQHVITGIGSKVISLPRHHMALSWSGHVGRIEDLEAAVFGAGNTQHEIFSALPDVVEKIGTANVAIGQRDGVLPPPFRLLIALWKSAENAGQLWAIHSTADIFGASYKPLTPVRLTLCTALSPSQQAQAFRRSVDYTNPTDFDVRRDGLTMIEAERALPWDDGHFAVGGFAELTSVTAEGVHQEILRSWPDKVGELINPNSDVQAPARGLLSRLKLLLGGLPVQRAEQST